MGLVPVVGLEPTRGISPTDFESVTSTNSITPACIKEKHIYYTTTVPKKQAFFSPPSLSPCYPENAAKWWKWDYQ